tara:strand:- start:637 stop:1623 length:987 start_codon:yes stop_codon:yes gene_type:complete
MKIYIFNSDEYQDYLSDLINYYLIKSSHEITTNYIPPFLFNDYKDISSLYGKGFTLYGKLESALKDEIQVTPERSTVSSLLDNNIDLIIFTSVRRSFKGKNIAKDYLNEILSKTKRSKLIAIDGEDDNLILENIAKEIKYYKRELLPRNLDIAHPISFSFPEFFQNIKNLDISKKTNILAPMDPRFLNSYIFDEESYFKQYANSIFGTTTKKNGWDCLRHYEIIASGCLPYFPQIDDKPETIMKNYPTNLQIDINKIFEKIILNASNIDSAQNFSKTTKNRTLNRAIKKMSNMNILENNLNRLQNYIDGMSEWFNEYGKSNIYDEILD